jgi:hypothetical protein
MEQRVDIRPYNSLVSLVFPNVTKIKSQQFMLLNKEGK